MGETMFSEQLISWNMKTHRALLWRNLGGWEGWTPQYLWRPLSIFSQNESCMIFSYNLLHVADKENLLQTPEGRAVRVLVFYHNSRSYFFCGFNGAWTDSNGCRQLLDQTHRPFVSRTQAKPRPLRSKAFSHLLVSLEKKGSPAKSLLQAAEAFICFCWDESV